MTPLASRIARIALHISLFASAAALYAGTLNPDVQPADSGEFQIAAITLGIAHPPGYPLFTMLGWLFAQAPFGSAFARVSFLSVIASAATLVVVARTVERVAQAAQPANTQVNGLTATVAGLLAAVALGTSTTFWAQATTTNIRSLTAFFAALLVYATARIFCDLKERGKARVSSIALFAIAIGLGVGHHASLAFAGVVFGVYALWAGRRSRLPRWSYVVAGFCFALTQLVWLYLPLRDAAGARFAPGNLNTLDGLLYHIFARGFAGDMFAFAAPDFLGDRLSILPTLLTFQFSPPVLALCALALVILVWRRAAFGATLLVAWALHLFVTLTYRAPQTVEYALPAWVMLSVALGAGIGIAGNLATHASGRWRTARRLPYLLLAGVLTIVLLRDAGERLPSYTALARDRTTRQLAAGALEAAASGATILAMWHQATPMWALQDVESLRQDVRVAYVYPRGAQPYAETFAELAAAAAQAGPAYVVNHFGPAFEARFTRIAPMAGHPIWRIDPDDENVIPAGAPAGFDNNRIQAGLLHAPEATARAGSAFNIDVFWEAADIQPGESLTFRIMRLDGRLAANADFPLDAATPSTSASTSTHYRRLTLGLPSDMLPGEYFLYAGVYRAGEQGFEQLPGDNGADFIPLKLKDRNPAEAVIRVLPAPEPPVTRHPQYRLRLPFEPATAAPELIGVDYDTGIAGQLRVHTHWRLSSEGATVTILSAEGQPLAPAQRLPPATQTATPEYLTLRFDTPQWKRLRALVSSTTSSLDLPLPDFSDGERYVPFGNQMVLVGASAWREGDQMRVDLQWLSARAITTDYVISARIAGDNLFVTHDSVPALGAIPTLKWIRGSQVTDRHTLRVGDYAGDLIGTVIVYNGFTQQPLPALDERYPRGVTFYSGW
ncbi:MAG: glycosyltransferase family 117 protein [Candidatus Roseilinea sp.]|uniref:glycosyltransferase family 117 protein n=1 Tax=Candidatus Roseilinea sp. TaxID=2838777 RepID=UPI00404B5993